MSAIALLTFLCKTERSCLETDLNFLRFLTGLLHYDSPATTGSPPPTPPSVFHMRTHPLCIFR